MRVFFQVRQIMVIMPHGVRECELAADFQIKPCDPRQSLKDKIQERRKLRIEKTYPGKLAKFHELLPPALQRQIKYKQKQLADQEFKKKFEQQREDKLDDDSS